MGAPCVRRPLIPLSACRDEPGLCWGLFRMRGLAQAQMSDLAGQCRELKTRDPSACLGGESKKWRAVRRPFISDPYGIYRGLHTGMIW